MLKHPERSLRAPIGLVGLLSCLLFLWLSLASSLLFAHADSALRPSADQVNRQPPATLLPVFTHKATQELPDVDAGRIVWQDARFGPTDLYLWSPTQPEPLNLTNSRDWEIFPDLDGDWLIWKDGYQGLGIHGLQLSTGERLTVTVGQHALSRPYLSNQVVVWADDRAGQDDWNIYGYELTTGRLLTISDAPGNQADPQIDWPWVVWWDFQERIYLYNLESGATQTVLGTRGARLPTVSATDQLVVWQDIRNGDWDLYGFDLVKGQEVALVKAPGDQAFAVIDDGLVAFQSLTPSGTWNIGLWVRALDSHFLVDPQSSVQSQPAIDQGQVVWQDSRNHQLDLFQYSWAGMLPTSTAQALTTPANLQVGAFPDRKIWLQWEDKTGAAQGFTIERATGITGTAWVTIAQLPPDQREYRDQPPTVGESYWYRVRGADTAGSVAYSNEAFGTTFTTGPTPDEAYLITLINEARADPAHFGYDEYAPVPPLVPHELVGYAARSQSQAILNSGFQFGHCDIIGRCPPERARAVGYAQPCVENLVTAFTTGPAAMEEANRGFLESEGHRNSMLEPNWTTVGVGHTFDLAKGDNRHGQVTEQFCGGEVTIPPLPSGAMVSAADGKSATFVVNYYSASGKAPTDAQLFVDGEPYALRLRSGVAAHGTYTATVPLDQRINPRYFFRFVYDNGKVAYWPPDAAPILGNHTTYLPFIIR